VKFLLDSNACIGWLRLSQPKLVARIKQQLPTDLAICSVVVGELIYGAERSAAAHRANNFLRIEQLRRGFFSLPFDDVAAERYGNVRAQLSALGTPIGPNDLMIAAIALAHRLTVVTNNTAEFSRVPGLSVDDWQ
jgi:tRNA(fMet)-specific endonuclease VapC